MKILKNFSNTVSVIFCSLTFFVILICNQRVYAIDIPVEIQCSKDYITTSWFIIPGQTGSQYTLTTKGIREDMKENIEEVTKPLYVNKMHNGLSVCIEARCIPSDKAKDVSLTGSFFTCGIGEGIKIMMFEPNSSNPDQYHYVGTLTITQKDTTSDIDTNKMNLLSSIELALQHFSLSKPI